MCSKIKNILIFLHILPFYHYQTIFSIFSTPLKLLPRFFSRDQIFQIGYKRLMTLWTNLHLFTSIYQLTLTDNLRKILKDRLKNYMIHRNEWKNTKSVFPGKLIIYNNFSEIECRFRLAWLQNIIKSMFIFHLHQKYF